MKPYADSNFFTRIYLNLPGSELANDWLQNAANRVESPLSVTWLHRLEVMNAFQQQVYSSRIHGQPRITPEEAATAQASFRHDLVRRGFLRAVPLDQERLASIFEDVSLRHTARYGFRVYDVIHISSALLLECDTFWSFDTKACRLAALEGLKLAKR
jgi:predicted nucleic acid-binding protein